MDIKNILDNMTSFIIDPSNDNRNPLTQGVAWMTTIILGIGTVGIAQGLSAIWRKLRHIDQNDTHVKISRLFQKIFPKNNTHIKSKEIKAIENNFTVNKSIAEQRKAHNTAKNYLQNELRKINAEVHFLSPAKSHHCPSLDEVEIKNALDPTIFAWKNTPGVECDIQKDGKLSDRVVLYGVASQFNSCEAVSRFTPKPGKAVETYKTDNSQGPKAQLQFPDQQIEIINNAGNLGFNGLCHVLDDATKMAVKHGYFTPETAKSADAAIRQLRANGNKMEYLCVGNIPKGEGNTEKVYEILVAAPAYGIYAVGSSTFKQQKEIQFLCALQAYRAQFQQAIQLATTNPRKQVIFKPTAPGLGVFGNQVDSVAKAFYVAAKEHENQLKKKNVKVQLQVWRGGGESKKMANQLRFSETVS